MSKSSLDYKIHLHRYTSDALQIVKVVIYHIYWKGIDVDDANSEEVK